MSKEKELSMAVAKTIKENQEKAMVMIANKMKKFYGEEVEEIAQPQRKTYAEAIAEGDVKTMLAHKFGMFIEQDRQQEQEALLSESIVNVSNEYRAIGDKIAKQQSLIEEEVGKAKSELKSDYEQRLKDFWGHRGGISEAVLRSEYYQKLEGIEGIEHIKALKEVLSKQIDRRNMLKVVVDKYIKDNHDLLMVEKQKEKLLEIHRAKILDLMD
jgi:hypothetical protein